MKKLCFFLLALLIPVIGFAQDYYLVGEFNNWTLKDANCQFSKQNDGSYVLDYSGKISGKFKINNGTWDNSDTFGGSGDLKLGEEFSLTKPGNDINIPEIENPHFVFNPSTLKLTVTQEEVTPPVEPVEPVDPVLPPDGKDAYYAIHGQIHGRPACTKNPDEWHSWFLNEFEDGWWSVTTNLTPGQFGIKRVGSNTEEGLNQQLEWIGGGGTHLTQLGVEYGQSGDGGGNFFNDIPEGLYKFMFNPTTKKIKIVEVDEDPSTVPVSVTLEFVSTGNTYTGDISNGFFNMRWVNVTDKGLRIWVNYADGTTKAYVSTNGNTYAKGEQSLTLGGSTRVTLLPHDINYDQVYNIEITWNGKFNDAKLKVIDVYPDQPVAYYLTGSFNSGSWADSRYKFTEVIGATNLYELNVASLPAGAEFRIDRGNGENRQEQFGSNGSALIPGQSYIAQKGTDNGIRINNGVALNNVRMVFTSETGEIAI